MNMHRLVATTILTSVLLLGCGSEPPETVDAVGSYDAYGAAITAEGAVPVQVVAAEADRFVGQSVTIEGTVAEVCQNMGCWLTLVAGPETAPIRVDVPRDSAGAYVYTFPKDIAGRRVVIAGILHAGDEAAHEHGDHATDEGDAHEMEAHGEAEEAAMTLDLAIVADGALVERIST